ncbi:hypothetical protein [Lacibacter sp.]|uniref:hypothetical protein n=1 Tax=Lacibacter sp. TaxID=1915409 RepID=UPI002B4B7E29|nr:hypothetical protein [Lacibacter sp.]HLP35432.1 hypothetical protein [Lacibacter sp.]
MFTFLSVLLLLFQIFSVIIPIIDKRTKSAWEDVKYSTLEKTLIIFTILSFGLSIAIFLIGQDSEKEKEKQAEVYQNDLRKKLAERDSLHQINDSIRTLFFIQRLDSSYTKSINASNDALAKYNLELVDSLNRVTNKINIKSQNKPQILIAPAEKGQVSPMYLTTLDNQNALAIKLVSSNNTRYNIKIRFYILSYKEENNILIYNIIDTGYIFYDRKFLVQDVISTSHIDIKKEFLQIENSIIFFQGSFSSDNENKDVYKFEEAYFFDFKKNLLHSPLNASLYSDIKSKLQKRGILKP